MTMKSSENRAERVIEVDYTKLDCMIVGCDGKLARPRLRAYIDNSDHTLIDLETKGDEGKRPANEEGSH